LHNIALASNPIYHARTKHIEVDYHFVREKVINKDISVRYLSIHDQIESTFLQRVSLSFSLCFFVTSSMVLLSPISLQGAVSKNNHNVQLPINHEANQNNHTLADMMN
jgi:hypothetical protein